MQTRTPEPHDWILLCKFQGNVQYLNSGCYFRSLLSEAARVFRPEWGQDVLTRIMRLPRRT